MMAHAIVTGMMRYVMLIDALFLIASIRQCGVAVFVEGSYNMRKKTTYHNHNDDGYGCVVGHGHRWWRGEGMILPF